MPTYGFELGGFEEPFSSVVLDEQRDVWPVVETLPGGYRDREDPLERRQFAVDGGRSGFIGDAGVCIGPHAIGIDIYRPTPPEDGAEVFDVPLRVVEGPPTVDAIVTQKAFREVV